MKKIVILAGICLTMCFSAIAQNNQRQGGQRGPRMMDAVVDTAIINHMGIDDAVLKKIYELQESKQAEQKEMMKNARPEKGQKMSEEARKAMQEKREAFTAQYRKELRALIGDETYIAYLEKKVDRSVMMRFGGQRQGQGGQRGGQRQGGGFGDNNDNF